MKIIDNPKAHHEYTILDTFEVGVVIFGWEVKSIKLGRVSLEESHVKVVGEEVFLVNAHVHPYQFTRQEEIDETRMRKLLLHKSEIIKLKTSGVTKGLSIVPLKIYEKRGKIKILIGLARGKKIFEKREEIKKRDMERTAAYELKWKQR